MRNTGKTKNKTKSQNAVPIFTVNDIEVHVYSSNKHVAVDSDFIDRRRGQSMSNNYKPHDLARDCPPMGQRHSQAQPSCYMNHLQQQTAKGNLSKCMIQMWKQSF